MNKSSQQNQNKLSSRIFFFLKLGSPLYLGFLLSIIFSKLYWGYFFNPPNIPKEVSEFERVISITPVSTRWRELFAPKDPFEGRSSISDEEFQKYLEETSKPVEIPPTMDLDIIEESEICTEDYDIGIKISDPCVTNRCDTEFCDTDRILFALPKKTQLPNSSVYISQQYLNDLYAYIEDANLLLPGYEHSRALDGIVIEAEGRNNQRYLFVGLTEVRNDHWPHYEFLFRFPDRNASPQLLSSNRFFYDVAGFEGLTWWRFLPFSIMFSSLLSGLIFIFKSLL